MLVSCWCIYEKEKIEDDWVWFVKMLEKDDQPGIGIISTIGKINALFKALKECCFSEAQGWDYRHGSVEYDDSPNNIKDDNFSNKIPFAKLEKYSCQHEYRFCFTYAHAPRSIFFSRNNPIIFECPFSSAFDEDEIVYHPNLTERQREKLKFERKVAKIECSLNQYQVV